MMDRIGVLYLRYSSHSQNEQSIETQRNICNAYAVKNGIKIVDEYIDKAMTGTNDKRKDFQRMIEDSKNQKFDFVIVYKMDRFARNRYDSAINKNKLKKNNVRVVSATENISDDKDGILLESLLEGLAEYYSANLSENIRYGMETNAKKGLSIGGNSLPLGYKSIEETREIVIDKETAPIVQKIFEMYRDKSTMAEIIRYLNINNLKTSRSNEFNKNSIRRLLTNEKYIGVYKFKGEIMPIRIPAIIDEKLFNEVQEMVKKRKSAPARARAKAEYLLTTKLYCGDCNSMMTGFSGTSGSSKRVYNYYACKMAKEKQCRKSNVSKRFIEDFVILKAQELLTDENINIIAHRLVEYVENERDKSNINRLKKIIKNNEKERNNLFDSLKLCTTDSMRLSILEEMSKMENNNKDLELELRFEEANILKLSVPQIKYFLKNLRKGNIYDEYYRQTITDIFVYRVYLYDNNDIMIIFTIQNNDFRGKIPSKKELISLFKGLSSPP